MGKLKDISPKKKGQIQALLMETTYSHRKVAETLKVSRSTVDRLALIVNRCEQNPTFSPKRVGKCGRTRITTPRTDRIIQKKLLTNRRLPMEQVKHQLEQEKIEVSSRTLRRRAREFGLKSEAMEEEVKNEFDLNFVCVKEEPFTIDDIKEEEFVTDFVSVKEGPCTDDFSSVVKPEIFEACSVIQEISIEEESLQFDDLDNENETGEDHNVLIRRIQSSKYPIVLPKKLNYNEKEKLSEESTRKGGRGAPDAAFRLAQREEIVRLHEEGMNLSAIARQLKISVLTVRKWVQRWKEGEDLNDKARWIRLPQYIWAKIDELERNGGNFMYCIKERKFKRI